MNFRDKDFNIKLQSCIVTLTLSRCYAKDVRSTSGPLRTT